MSLKEVADKAGGITAIETVGRMPMYEFIQYLSASRVEGRVAKNFIQQS